MKITLLQISILGLAYIYVRTFSILMLLRWWWFNNFYRVWIFDYIDGDWIEHDTLKNWKIFSKVIFVVAKSSFFNFKFWPNFLKICLVIRPFKFCSNLKNIFLQPSKLLKVTLTSYGTIAYIDRVPSFYY